MLASAAAGWLRSARRLLVASTPFIVLPPWAGLRSGPAARPSPRRHLIAVQAVYCSYTAAHRVNCAGQSARDASSSHCAMTGNSTKWKQAVSCSRITPTIRQSRTPHPGAPSTGTLSFRNDKVRRSSSATNPQNQKPVRGNLSVRTDKLLRKRRLSPGSAASV